MSETRMEFEKAIRQQEWNKVLNKTNIDENSEDLRPLKERLKEQQELKAKAWRESMFTLDDEDAEHLKNVAEMREIMENKIKHEDSIEIEEFKLKAAKIQEEEIEKKLHQSMFNKQKLKSRNTNSINRQKSLLLSGIKRKSSQADEIKRSKVMENGRK